MIERSTKESEHSDVRVHRTQLVAGGLLAVAALGAGIAIRTSRIEQARPVSNWRIAYGTAGDLTAVTCVSDDDCWAVGYQAAGPATIDHYDGKTWSVTTTHANAVLESVSCASHLDCWTVGSTGYEPVALHYTGREWTPAALHLPDTGEGSTLHAIACVGVSNCWAAGITSSTRVTPLFLQLTAKGWNAVSGPPVQDAGIAALACVSAAECWAVGNAGAGSDEPGHPLVEHYVDGSWTVAPSPDLRGSLEGVTCSGAGDCWAVGSSGASIPSAGPLIERYTGGRWSVVANPVLAETPNPGIEMRGAGIGSVACSGPSNCWAVGGEETASGYRYLSSVRTPLILSYGASGWALVNGPTTDAGLGGITCPTSRRCWAVGTNHDGSRAVIVTNTPFA